jgi:hypothetical protein
MTTTPYSKRLTLLYALCLNEQTAAGDARPSANLADYSALEAASYLACYLTFQAIQLADRSPADERYDNFEMLSVYQAFALLVYAYLALPLGEEELSPNLDQDAIVIAKSLFAELSVEELADIVDSGIRKFRLIGDAEAEHWMHYREDLDKVTLAFVIAGTDDQSPYEKEQLLPMFSSMLSMLCEAFASA